MGRLIIYLFDDTSMLIWGSEVRSYFLFKPGVVREFFSHSFLENGFHHAKHPQSRKGIKCPLTCLNM